MTSYLIASFYEKKSWKENVVILAMKHFFFLFALLS